MNKKATFCSPVPGNKSRSGKGSFSNETKKKIVLSTLC